MQNTETEVYADLKEDSELGMSVVELALNAQLSKVHENSEPNITKGLEMPENSEKAQTPIEAHEQEDIDLHIHHDDRDQTHDFISPYSQPLMKISLIDERLSGDTGGTKPVLEVPVSQVIENTKSRGSSFNLIGNKRGPPEPVD